MKNRLRVLRAREGLDARRKLATRLKKERRAPERINAIETEKFDPSLPLARIARLFGQPVEAIFEDDEIHRRLARPIMPRLRHRGMVPVRTLTAHP